MKIWCYNDVHNWGTMFAQSAQARGHDAHLFEDPRQPDQGFVFMHMHYHPQVRLLHKRMMAVMAMNANLKLIPSYRSSVLYDDKAEQARQLSKWMPTTRIFWTPNAARNYLEKITIPFISKSSEGAASANVRLVSTLDDARTEIRFAFSDIGIKCRYNQTQRGYLLWQDFIPDNSGDIRILAIGRKRLVIKRENKNGAMITNGSGSIVPVTHTDDEQVCKALAFANEFFAEEKMQWGGIDLVQDQVSGNFYVLETTVGWTMHSYYESTFIDEHGITDRKGDKIWEVLCEEIEQGAFA